MDVKTRADQARRRYVERIQPNATPGVLDQLYKGLYEEAYLSAFREALFFFSSRVEAYLPEAPGSEGKPRQSGVAWALKQELQSLEELL